MKKLFITVSVFLILILSITTGFPYNTKEKGEGGHVGLTEKSIELKKTKDIGLQKDLNDPNNYRSIMNAVSAEDAVITSEVIPRWMHHFYNPITGKGLPYFENARERAKKFYDAAVNSYCSGNKQKAWEMLGHALHPLQDMGSPPHVYNATHAFQQFFPTWGYENFVSNNWSQLEKQIVAEDCELSGGINNYIHQMALYTYSNYKKYDQEQITSSPISLDSILVSFNPPLYYTPIPVTRGEDPYPDPPNNTIALLNKVVCYSAGLIDTFWNDVYVNKCSPKLISSIPGGDHPDDTYEVSIPLEYGIDEAEYQCINMRLAMKKGRVGYYWAYLYGSKYQEIYNLPSDSPNEIIAQKFAELKDLEDLLNGYPYNETDDTNAAPDVAVLSNGYAEEAVRLLFKEKETARLIDPPFSINEVKNQPVFIIPSGGLYGLENSEILKSLLSEYVKNGGTLIVFSQQHGYEFSVLPVPQEADGAYNTMKGYGWTEDQSCLWNGTYIDTYHQILSAISTSTVSANVDGYFISYPLNSTILLRRTTNGQPAMLMYEYGNGRVVVSSLYSDWGYAHSQATQDEIKIVRNLISWAKKPEQLPEIKQGETVSVSVSVKNNVDIDASSIKFYIYNPDRTTVVDEQLLSHNVSAGQSAIIPISYAIPQNSALGIYHIDYELFNPEGNIIQPRAETDSGRFVVSNPPPSSYEISGLRMSVTAPSESVMAEQDIPITVTLWNYIGADDRVRLYNGWDHIPRTFLDEVTVPAKSSISKNYVIPNSASGRSFWVDVFSANGLKLPTKAAYHFTGDTWPYAGSYGKGFVIIYPSISLTTTTDKTLYSKGETVSLNVNLQNKQNISYTTTLKIKAIDPSNVSIYSNSLSVTLPANGISTQSLSFVLPQTAMNGFYIVSTEAYDEYGKKIGGGSASFEVPSVMLSIMPILIGVLTPNSTFQASFEVKNIWVTDVSAANLKVDFVNPTGMTLFTNTEEFSITSGQTKTFTYNIPTGHVVFGNYRLRYYLTYGEKVASGESIISRSYTIQNTFDRVTYSAGDTINATINITNTGKFQEELPLKVEVPGFSYSQTSSIFSLPQQTVSQSFLIPVPGDALSGKYVLIVTIGTTSITKTFDFYVPESKLELSVQSGTYNAGESIPATIINTGGGGTTYELNAMLTDIKGIVVSNQNFTGTITAKDTEVQNIAISSGALSGQYILRTGIKDKTTGKIINSDITISIAGISGTLSTRTEKDVYLETEGIKAITDVVSTGMGIPDAELNLKVIATMKTGTIRGSITNAETGVPIQGAKISVGGKETYTTSQGEYALVNVSQGLQIMNIIYPGFDRIVSYINVLEGAQTYDASLYQSKYGTLSGTIKDASTGAPVIGVKIEIFSQNVASSDQLSKILHSDFIGSCTLNNFPVGNYAVKVTKPNYFENNVTATIQEGTSTFYINLQQIESIPDINETEANNSIGEATPLPLDVSGFGTIYPNGDADYYKINIPAKGTIKVTLGDIPTGQSYWVRLWTSSGTVIQSSGYVASPGPAILSKLLDNEGEYYIDVWSYSGYSSTSPYRIKAEFVPLDEDIYSYNEPNESIPVATILPLDKTELAYIYPAQDTDYYKVTLSSAGTIKITVSDIPSGKSYRVQLFNNAGGWLAGSGYVTSPGPAVLSYSVNNGGDYYIEIWSYSGYSSTSPYRIYITFIPKELPVEKVIFEKTISSINFSGSQTINENVPPVGMTGKFLILGTLKSNTSQVIDKSEYPFYTIKGDTILLFNADKNIFKSGETVTIVGEVQNRASITISGVSLVLNQLSSIGGQDIYSAILDIPANGSYLFTVTTVAGTEGTYILTGKVTQDGLTLIEISDQYDVVSPNVTATVSSPEVVDNEPFNINVELKNEGKAEAVVSLESSIDSQTQTVTIPAGETKLIQYNQQITNNTTYTFTFTGDLNQSITKTVSYGLGASIAINPLTAYPEGRVSIPVTITNIGQLDENLTLTFSLQPSSLVQQKTYFIAKNGSLTDTLYFDLTEGGYELSASSQQPTASTYYNFTVRKENKVGMSISVGTQSNEFIPVSVNLINLGYNEVSGSVQFSAVSSQGQIVWNGSHDVSLPSSPTPIPYSLTFNINPSAIVPGNYILKGELLSNSNRQISISSQPLIIQGPIFQITQLPPSQTFTAGEEAMFTFKVKNTGNKEGAFDFHFMAYDLIDSTKKEWLMPNEEKTVTFSFMLPIDLEEKDYYADYELKGQGSSIKGQVLYHLEGISLSVDSSLDKQYYSESEIAHLTVVVSQESGVGSLNLFTRVNYNGYESQQLFTLNGTETLAFDVPLAEITGGKLFYGVYHESGRSIHLNSFYIYKEGDVLTITTDKQVYNPGETVSMGVNSVSGATGTLTLSAPNYSETFTFTGTTTKSLTLPATMTAGTYYVSYDLLTTSGETFIGSHPFDVAGIYVKVKEATLDKGKYAISDTLNLGLTIESNQNLSATLKAWIVDPEGKFVSAGERDISLSSSNNLLITHNSSLVTAVSGIHRLVYGIYTGDLLLVSGSEAFDVGDAVLTGITTNKTDYPTNTEFVNVTVSMYGTVDAILELQLDRDTVRTQPIALNGFSTLNIELGTAEPGTHILKAMLTAGGLKSTKETSFTYALSLLDSDNDGMPDEWEIAHGLDPNNPDANLDPDNDELPNLQEYQHETNPNNPDTDNDGMPDGWEVTYDLNPNANDASSDKDNDGFSNLQEYQSGSNPTDPTIIPNQPPVANAGADQNVITGTLVTLDGSGSYDPEGAMITFQWTFIEVPAGSNITDASLSDATSPKPTFTPDVNGTYRLELVINDGVLESAPDEVAIIASAPNVAPNANAGPDQNVSTDATVYLDGLESNDPDNGPQLLSYLWTFGSIPGGSYLTNDHITNRDQISASFIPDIDGSYVINLTVNDGELSSLDTVKIMAATPNVPPNANAGPDITLYLGEIATLDGSPSNDPDNGPLPLSYRWRFVAVPTGSQFTNDDITEAGTVSPSFTPDVSGTYVIELMVSDGIDSSFDNMAVTVIKKATFCSILGNDPKPSILDQDIFKFSGAKGEMVTVWLEANLSGAGSRKRATLLLTDNIKGTLLLKLDRSELPNKIKAILPATGEYLITVAEQPKIAKGERYRGAYCLSLEASQETMQTLKPAFWVE